MALEVGIVGLPNSGKTTLFNALTRAGAEITAYASVTHKPNVGMATITDERSTGSPPSSPRRRSRPRRSASSTSPAPAPSCSATSGRSTRSSPCSTASRRTRRPQTTSRRSSLSVSRPRPRRAPSRASREGGEVGRRGEAGRARHPDRASRISMPGRPRRPGGRASPGTRTAHDEAAARRRERPRWDRLQARGRACRAARRGGGGVSRRAFGARRGRAEAEGRARADHVLHRGR